MATHHCPDLAARIRSSVRLERLRSALLRTPPQTTTSATLHTISWHSMDVSLRPAAALNVRTRNLKSSSSGSGPEARPPNVLRGVPAGRIFDRSQLGICPAYSRPTSWRVAEAQPILESRTLMMVSTSWNSSATSGSLLMCWRSTENPTPVPHIRIYMISSNTLGLSTAT